MPWRPGVSKWQERRSGSEKGAVARGGARGTSPRNYSPEYACRPLNQSEPE